VWYILILAFISIRWIIPCHIVFKHTVWPNDSLWGKSAHPHTVIFATKFLGTSFQCSSRQKILNVDIGLWWFMIRYFVWPDFFLKECFLGEGFFFCSLVAKKLWRLVTSLRLTRIFLRLRAPSCVLQWKCQSPVETWSSFSVRPQPWCACPAFPPTSWWRAWCLRPRSMPAG